VTGPCTRTHTGIERDLVVVAGKRAPRRSNPFAAVIPCKRRRTRFATGTARRAAATRRWEKSGHRNKLTGETRRGRRSCRQNSGRRGETPAVPGARSRCCVRADRQHAVSPKVEQTRPGVGPARVPGARIAGTAVRSSPVAGTAARGPGAGTAGTAAWVPRNEPVRGPAAGTAARGPARSTGVRTRARSCTERRRPDRQQRIRRAPQAAREHEVAEGLSQPAGLCWNAACAGGGPPRSGSGHS
jgi:hypothetical protein